MKIIITSIFLSEKERNKKLSKRRVVKNKHYDCDAFVNVYYILIDLISIIYTHQIILFQILFFNIYR